MRGKLSLVLSSLNKTWIFDLDGTLVKHNGHLMGGDILLPGVYEFFQKIPENDVIVLMTARGREYQSDLERFLIQSGIRFDHILYGMPYGERILVNDIKPSGLKTAYAVNKLRDAPCDIDIVIDPDI